MASRDVARLCVERTTIGEVAVALKQVKLKVARQEYAFQAQRFSRDRDVHKRRLAIPVRAAGLLPSEKMNPGTGNVNWGAQPRVSRNQTKRQQKVQPGPGNSRRQDRRQDQRQDRRQPYNNKKQENRGRQTRPARPERQDNRPRQQDRPRSQNLNRGRPSNNGRRNQPSNQRQNNQVEDFLEKFREMFRS